MSVTEPGQSIQWRWIFLSATLGAAVSIAVCYGVLSLITALGLFCSCPPDYDLFQCLGYAFACFLFGIVPILALLYFVLTAVIALLILRKRVRERRGLHTLLTVLISIPIAVGLVFLVDFIDKRVF